MKYAIALALLFIGSVAHAQNTDSRPRVFITDSESWVNSKNGGGSRHQNAELVKTFQERCPAVVITNKQEKAEFTITFDHEGDKGPIHKHDKIAIFNHDGDAIFSASTRSLGTAVKDACTAIESAKR